MADMMNTLGNALQALRPFVQATVTAEGHIVGLMREDFERARSAAEKLTAIQAARGADEPVAADRGCQELGYRPVFEHPSVEAAAAMGRTGGHPTEGERLAFEAWMAGHNWSVIGDWNGQTYVLPTVLRETGGVHSPEVMLTRQLWAAWRDRAALGVAGVKDPASNHGEMRETIGSLSDADAVAIAHESGFAGRSWSMGPEELAHVLNVAANGGRPAASLSASHHRTEERDPASIRPGDQTYEGDGAALIGGTFSLEPGDQRLLNVLVTALGPSHPAINDLVALIMRSNAHKRSGRGEPAEMMELTEAQLASACMSFRHDFGLRGAAERTRIMLDAKGWHKALQREYQR